MKKRKVLCILFAAIFALSVFPGCKKDNKQDSSDTGAAAVKAKPELSSESKSDLTLIRPGLDADNAEAAENKAISQYQAKYGGTVTIETATYDDWKGKVLQAYTSGTSIDVIYGDNAYYPLFAMKHYTEPLENYVDLNADYVSMPAEDAYFKYQGNYYLAASAQVSPSVLFYNKNMIQEYGLEDPVQLYREGKWNFDTFKEMCMKVTDPTNSVWGLANWYSWFFLGANHTALCKINDAGKYELNFDDPAVKYSLEYAEDAYYTTKWRGLEGGDIWNSWYQGRDLFVNEYEWTETGTIIPAKNEGDFNFDYGVAPLPYGPNNTDHYNICNDGGYGIGTNCENPYHAGQLIAMILNQTKVDTDTSNKDVPQDHLDMYNELSQKPYNDTYYDSAVDNGSMVMNSVTGGTPVQKALDALRDNYQGMLDDANGTNS